MKKSILCTAILLSTNVLAQELNINTVENLNICVKYETRQTCKNKENCDYVCALSMMALSIAVPAGKYLRGACLLGINKACGNICQMVPECATYQVCVEWTQP